MTVLRALKHACEPAGKLQTSYDLKTAEAGMAKALASVRPLSHA